MRKLAFLILASIAAACGSGEDYGSVIEPDLRVADVHDYLVVICDQAARCPDISPTQAEIDDCPSVILPRLSNEHLAEVGQFTAYSNSRQDCVLECVEGVICGRFGVALSAISAADAVEPMVECGWECQPSSPEGEEPATVARVSITPDSAAFGLGLTVRLTATVYDAAGHSLNDRTIHWASSDTEVATVDESGSVTGVSAGSAIISALCEDHEAAATITVRRVSILVDASRDGGVWWFPQAGAFDPDLDHQGKALADYFRSLDLYVSELPRPTQVSWSLIQGYNLVVRSVACGGYSVSEVSAYRRYVEEGGSLLLLDDHKRHCPTDDVGRAFGLRFEGITRGRQELTFVPDPITEGLEDGGLAFAAGSGLVQIPTEAKILAYLDEDSWLDLNDNESRDINEPVAPPVMGRMTAGDGLIVFMGDANLIEAIPQPFTDNVLQALLPGVVTEPHGAEAGTVFLAYPECVAGCD